MDAADRQTETPVIFRPPEGLRAIISGAGSVGARLAGELEELGIQRPMIVCGSQLAKSPVLANITGAAGRPTSLFAGSRPHTPVGAVDQGRAAAIEHGADGLIAIGGGSAVDCAKAIAVLAKSGLSSIRDVPTLSSEKTLGGALGGNYAAAMHVVCIPTTLSMAEFNPFFGVRDPDRASKDPYGDHGLVARTIFLDGEIAAHTPAGLWAETGVKAFDDALWRFCSEEAEDPASDTLLALSIRDLLRLLPRSSASGDPGSRQRVFMAAWLSSHPMPRTRPAVRRRWFSMVARHALGGLLELPHGIGSCVAVGPGLRYHLEATRHRQVLLASELQSGAAVPRDSSLIEIVGRFIAELAVPASLSQLGVPRTALGELLDGMLREAPDLGGREQVGQACEQMW